MSGEIECAIYVRLIVLREAQAIYNLGIYYTFND
jgi:hypothetical protein